VKALGGDVMLDTKTINSFYQDISKEEIDRYQSFLENHAKKRTTFGTIDIEYYSCGKGEKAILLPPGGMAILPPEFGFRSILHFERNYRVIALDVKQARSIGDICDAINHVLKTEKIKKVIVVGGSGAGFFAQAYFKREFSRVEAMILFNTIAPKKERNKKSSIWIVKILPDSLLKFLFKKKAKKLLQAKVPSQAVARVRFYGALLNEMVSKRFSKQVFLPVLKLAMEFNETGGYTREDFEGWQGQVLLITCEDDPGFKDIEYLKKNLPQTQLYTFPKGLKHMAHIVEMDKFFKVMEEFLDQL
jgi:pimeloyl-ACP methyl ester carboxylesterase